jgi:ring-1,2-phenylacetyl-CoA epoxidase subunit PaaC
MSSNPVVPDGLQALIASLADNKYFLGRRYAEWCTSAPALEAAVAAAAMAQDEIGHARSLYPLLRDIAGASPEVEPETRTHFAHVSFLSTSFSGWTDFVAANFLFDTALTIVFEAAAQSSLAGLAQRAQRIRGEERLHWLHGEGWTRRLAGEGEGVQRVLQCSFDAIVPQTLGLFDLASASLVDTGILDRDADQLRREFQRRIRPILDDTSVSV